MWQPNLKKENIYIIDATDMPLRAVCAVAKDDKLFIKNYQESHPDELANSILYPALISEFLSQLNIAKNSKVIFLWNGANAATFSSKIRLEKQRSDIPLAQTDLSRIFGTATFQFFNQFREEAKGRFKVDDLGLVLASSRILDFKLDGETYINVASVKAKHADVSIEQTFLRRGLHEAINGVLSSTCGVLHVEIGTALHALAKLSGYGVDDALLLHAGHIRAHLYAIAPDLPVSGRFNSLVQYRGDLPSGTNIIFKALYDRLGVRAADADAFIVRIINGGASVRLTSHVKRIIFGECVKYIKDCRTHIPETENLLFFTQEPLATFLERLGFTKNYSCAIPASLHLKDIAQQEIRPSPGLSPRALSPVFFAGLIAYWSRLGDNYLEARNQGNVKWLIPHNSI